MRRVWLIVAWLVAWVLALACALSSLWAVNWEG